MENLKRNAGCIILLAVFIASILFSVYENSNKRKELARIKQTQDSITHTPEYIDSVTKAKENKYRLRKMFDSIKLSNTIVITKDDGVYHYYSCDKISTKKRNDSLGLIYYIIADKEEYRITTEDEALSLGNKKCVRCKELNEVIKLYEAGKLINVDDIYDYLEKENEEIYYDESDNRGYHGRYN